MRAALRKAASWRPAWWIALRRRVALFDNRLLIDNRRTAESNAYVARQYANRMREAARKADEEAAHYERELRKVDAAIRENNRIARDDAMTLAARGAR